MQPYMLSPKITTVLFDLDGTLLDTAPDLAFALNTVLENNHHLPLPFETIRPAASHGTKGLLQVGFNITESDPDFPKLRDEFLEIYQQHLCDQTKLFPGIPAVLSYLVKNNLQWGIVTNKPAWLTDPLLTQLNLPIKPICVVSGDTVSNRKPHPEPMLHACKLIPCNAGQCVYIGDAERDIQAGKNTNMHTLVALYGYIGKNDHPETWGADAMIQQPEEIIGWLEGMK